MDRPPPLLKEPVEDDPVEDDPVEDDPVEDDPVEDEPVEDEPEVDGVVEVDVEEPEIPAVWSLTAPPLKWTGGSSA